MTKKTQRRRQRRKHYSRKYRGGNLPTLPVFSPKNLKTLSTTIPKATTTIPKATSNTTQSTNMPPLTSNMAVVEHNKPTMYDVCGNKSTIEHISDSVQQITSHPAVVGAKTAVLDAMSGVVPGAKKMFGLEGGKIRHRHRKRSLRKRKQRTGRKLSKKSLRSNKK